MLRIRWRKRRMKLMMVYVCIFYTCVYIYMSPRLPYVYECITTYLYICIYVYIESESKQGRASSWHVPSTPVCIWMYYNISLYIYLYIESESKQGRASSCEFVRISARWSELVRSLTHPNKQELAVIRKNRRDLARTHSDLHWRVGRRRREREREGEREGDRKREREKEGEEETRSGLPGAHSPAMCMKSYKMSIQLTCYFCYVFYFFPSIIVCLKTPCLEKQKTLS